MPVPKVSMMTTVAPFACAEAISANPAASASLVRTGQPVDALEEGHGVDADPVVDVVGAVRTPCGGGRWREGAADSAPFEVPGELPDGLRHGFRLGGSGGRDAVAGAG